jgi:hypothetical protein
MEGLESRLRDGVVEARSQFVVNAWTHAKPVRVSATGSRLWRHCLGSLPEMMRGTYEQEIQRQTVRLLWVEIVSKVRRRSLEPGTCLPRDGWTWQGVPGWLHSTF